MVLLHYNLLGNFGQLIHNNIIVPGEILQRPAVFVADGICEQFGFCSDGH